VRLRHAILGCHLILLAALVTSVLPPLTMLRLTVAAMLALPLLVTLRGIVQQRRVTLQRLAVLLVAYIGVSSVEVVARSGGSRALSIALLAAVLELGLTLSLIRRSARNDPRARE
jgi:uncharacterized membrane protein